MGRTVESRKQELQDELDRITNILINQYNAEKIILFGSMATGDIHEWSDIDLIVIKKTKEPFIKRLKNASLLIGSNVSCDLIIYTEEEFEKMKKEKRSFAKDVMKKGKVIYSGN